MVDDCFSGEEIFMNSEDEMLVKEKLLRLLSETEKYDFPFLAGVDKKKLIIITRKHDLDEKMLGIMSIFRLKIPSLFLFLKSFFLHLNLILYIFLQSTFHFYTN